MSKEEAVKIVRLKVLNFEGLECIEIEPGDVNFIEGETGSGKTSLLNAIAAAFTNRSPRGEMVHVDADRGQIVFELSNGLRGKRDVDRSGYTAGPIDVDKMGLEVSAPQTFLQNMLGDGFGFDPLSFVKMSPSEQAEVLLQKLVKIDVGRSELIELSGGEELPGVSYDGHPIDVVSDIERALFERRTRVNRAIRESRAEIASCEDSIPADFDPEGVRDADLRSLTKKLSDTNAKNDKISRLTRERKDVLERIQSLSSKLSSIDEELSSLEEKDVAPIEEKIASYQEASSTLATYDRMRDLQDRVRDKEMEAENLSDLVEDARAKPKELLSRGEIPPDLNLSVSEEGVVLVDGVQLSSLSTGEKLKVSLAIAKESLGELRVVLADEFDTMDKNLQQQVIDAFSDEDVQLFITRVTEDSLTVRVLE